MNNLEQIADNFLSTNDHAVISKKRENFKKAVQLVLNEYRFHDDLCEQIVQKTFDEGVVN